MEKMPAEDDVVYSVFQHYDGIADKCYQVIQNHQEEVPVMKIKDYINNDVIRRILIARNYEEDKAVDMWKKWFVRKLLTNRNGDCSISLKKLQRIQLRMSLGRKKPS
jgi:hypothetical protein